jgi:hypothetical protein
MPERIAPWRGGHARVLNANRGMCNALCAEGEERRQLVLVKSCAHLAASCLRGSECCVKLQVSTPVWD